MRKNSIKNNRINAEIQRELSDLIRNEMKDPRVHMMTSVTRVAAAPDLKTCKVYISVLGSEEDRNETMTGLKKAEGFLRSGLARRLNLRNTPELIFLSDTSIEYGIDMIKKIEALTSEEGGADE